MAGSVGVIAAIHPVQQDCLITKDEFCLGRNTVNLFSYGRNVLAPLTSGYRDFEGLIVF